MNTKHEEKNIIDVDGEYYIKCVAHEEVCRRIIEKDAKHKADWLRSEIEKIVLPTPPDVLIPGEGPIEHALREGEYFALTSIITRYKEELKVLEN